MKVLAVDAGFAQVKAYSGAKQVIFPTAVAQPATINCKDVVGNAAKRYTIGDKTLVVGDDALQPEVTQDYNLEVADLIDNVPFLVAKAADLAGIDLATVEVLVLGLQISGFVKNKAKLFEIMSSFTVNGITYTPKVLIVPQAAGALQAYLCETAVRADDEEGFILDCGGNTLHVLSYRGGMACSDGTQIYDKKGVAAAAKKVCVLLQERTDRQYSIPEALVIMRKGWVKHRGHKINLSNEIREILDSHFSELVREIQTDFSKIFDAKDRLVLAGGGAELLKKHLPEIWQPMIFVISDPEFANARGFFHYAKGV